MDVPYLVRRAVRERPKAPAVFCDGRERTYEELDARAQRLANGLRRLGLHHQDRVAVLLENRVEYPEVDVALAYGGFVRVALNVRLGIEDFRYTLADSGARAIVTEARFDAEVAQFVEELDLHWIRVGPDDRSTPGHAYEDLIATASSQRVELSDQTDLPAWISYTSGSTGRPKGVVLSHRALGRVAMNIMMELGPVTGASSILLTQPLSHGSGFFVLPYFAAGARVGVMSRFDPDEALRLGRDQHIGSLKLVPTMLNELVKADGRSTFDTIIYGAAPISEPQLETALERFGSLFVQIYGQTEAPVTITVLHKEDHKRPGPHRRSAGRPWRSVEVEVLHADGARAAPGELGELVVRSDHLMDGYFGQPELTADTLRDGWLWTRDMALVDDEGYIHLRGRRDEMINSGGYNIAPKEVEDVLARHPAVDECAVVDVPHPKWGQAVHAYVALRPGTEVSERELRDFCKPVLGFRRPQSIAFVEALPRSAYGKVDRARLQEPSDLDVVEGLTPSSGVGDREEGG